MNDDVMKARIGAVLTGLTQSFDEELAAMDEPGLGQHWHFKWDASKSVEWNTYRFHELLGLYGRVCRRWEELHHGSCCVVETVRDKYLMPKIRAFLAALAAHAIAVHPTDAASVPPDGA